MKSIDIRGRRFGRLIALRRDGHKGKRTAWLCLCDCGNEAVVTTTRLQSGSTESCGCLATETSLRNIRCAQAPRPAIERFSKRVTVDEQAGCKIWTGAKNSSGYGSFVLSSDHSGKHRKMVIAHRFAWELENGAIPEGLCVLHKCDNRLCVNVEHLFLGTRDDNNKDRAAKGRSADTHGERHHRAKLTDQQAAEALLSSESTSQAAMRLKVSYHTIHKLRKGKNWKKLKEAIAHVC